uniref:Mucin-5AC-like n=1 Tax=Globodera pallida TaxID=36090 RepID=A0A183CP73_GLOPA
MCAPVINKLECVRIAKEDAMKNGVTVTNFDCKCPYGAEGEDFSNAKFEILPIPISTLLTCKKADFDSEEYGGAYKAECSHDEDKYCYIASCAKGNKHVMTVWNCSPDTNCTAISAQVGETLNATVTCECLFGKANANLANENFTLPMVPPPTTTQKPTTTTGKPTTTTDKTTTPTDKTTTTTDKTTTTTDKPMTTTDKPTTTTAEANLGVRAKISVCSGVLLAIGHVLASVLPKFGVDGQLFNDL